MTPDALAALHAQSFPAYPRPWSASEFGDLLAAPGVFLLDQNAGFLMGRIVLDEAELLTVAVDPLHRRGGIGRSLMSAFANRAARRGATRAFLEVADTNTAAIGLYQRAGWARAGFRRGYYAPGVGAVVMTLALDQTAATFPDAGDTRL